MEHLKSKETIRKEVENILAYEKERNHIKPDPSNKWMKSTLTRWIKSAEEYYNEISAARKRPLRERYYLGTFITYTIVQNAKNDVEVMKEMREELNETKEPR
jgi:hypothetical protein